MIRAILFFGLRGEKEGGICSNFLFYSFSPLAQAFHWLFRLQKTAWISFPHGFPGEKTIKRFSGPKKGGVSNRGLIQLHFLEIAIDHSIRDYTLCVP
jgi:hypothetical protein